MARHTYFPYGEEATDPLLDTERMKFTGHERDVTASRKAQLDYMHARFYSPDLGRFLGPDPIASSALEQPQSWNKYNYAISNPVKYVDPDGKAAVIPIAIGIAAGGLLFGPSAANAPSSLQTPLIESRGLPLDVLAAEAAFGPVGEFFGKALGRLAGRLRQALSRSASEAVEAGAETFSRDLTAADLGVEGRILELRGSISTHGQTTTVQIDMIKGEIANPMAIINNIVARATESGASRVQIRGLLANPRLDRILRQRYGLSTQDGLDVIEIEILPSS